MAIIYLWNAARDLGDAVGFTMGMGVALNEKASFSIAYDHATVFRTQQNGVLITDNNDNPGGIVAL